MHLPISVKICFKFRAVSLSFPKIRSWKASIGFVLLLDRIVSLNFPLFWFDWFVFISRHHAVPSNGARCHYLARASFHRKKTIASPAGNKCHSPRIHWQHIYLRDIYIICIYRFVCIWRWKSGKREIQFEKRKKKETWRYTADRIRSWARRAERTWKR